jgi:hypothetical protein
MAIEHDLAELIAEKDRYKDTLTELVDFIDRASESELARTQQFRPYVDAKSLLLAAAQTES